MKKVELIFDEQGNILGAVDGRLYADTIDLLNDLDRLDETREEYLWSDVKEINLFPTVESFLRWRRKQS